MKDLDSMICKFAVVFCIKSGVTTACLIGVILFKECSILKVAIFAACVLTVMSGIILTVLLLMKKQILPEVVHNENVLHKLLTKMVTDSSIEEKCKKERDKLRDNINSEIVKVKEQLKSDFETSLNELKTKIDKNNLPK